MSASCSAAFVGRLVAITLEAPRNSWRRAASDETKKAYGMEMSFWYLV